MIPLDSFGPIRCLLGGTAGVLPFPSLRTPNQSRLGLLSSTYFSAAAHADTAALKLVNVASSSLKT
jgi:hypothetical protein